MRFVCVFSILLLDSWDWFKYANEICIGKPVDPDLLRKIESIVNDQIKAELEVSAKEATLSEAKRINGLRAVFGEVTWHYDCFLIKCIFFCEFLHWRLFGFRFILTQLELSQLVERLRTS